MPGAETFAHFSSIAAPGFHGAQQFGNEDLFPRLQPCRDAGFGLLSRGSGLRRASLNLGGVGGSVRHMLSMDDLRS